MSTGLDHENFTGTIATTLADPHLQKAVYTATGRLMSHRRSAIAPDLLPDYQELREQARRVKLHTIENLDWYLEESNATLFAHGGHVHWCRNAEEVAETVLRIARPRGVKLIVKSKSMTSEEVHLNDRLEAHGIESVETDLGEYILQLLKQRPYHIIAPALH